MVETYRFDPYEYFGALEMSEMPSEDNSFEKIRQGRLIQKDLHPRIKQMFEEDDKTKKS